MTSLRLNNLINSSNILLNQPLPQFYECFSFNLANPSRVIPKTSPTSLRAEQSEGCWHGLVSRALGGFLSAKNNLITSIHTHGTYNVKQGKFCYPPISNGIRTFLEEAKN